MKTIVEDFEIKKNNFSKGLYLALIVLSAAAFFISINESDNTKWISLFGIVSFGAGYWLVLKSRIRVVFDGFTVYDVRKEKFVAWKDITALNYHSVYHGHGTELRLTVLYDFPVKKIDLPVKQFNKEKMQRFF
jgi:hypothetical protein